MLYRDSISRARVRTGISYEQPDIPSVKRAEVERYLIAFVIAEIMSSKHQNYSLPSRQNVIIVM